MCRSNHNINFVAVPDGLPEDDPRLSDVIHFCEAVMAMEPIFQDFFARLVRETAVSCVIHDITMSCVYKPAKKLGLPLVGFVTPSAVSLHCYNHVPEYIAAGLLPLPPPSDPSFPSLDPLTQSLRPAQNEEEAAARHRPVTCLTGLSPEIRVQDLPSFMVTHDLNSFFMRFLANQNKYIPVYDCLLMNTFYELEAPVIDAMGTQNPNIFPIGPLIFTPNYNCADGADGEVPVLADTGSALWAQDAQSLKWLDQQKPSSVLYISFGSIATMSVDQMKELAHGLEMSHHQFLWVVRPDLVANIDQADSSKEKFAVMFAEFVERTKDRALVLPWVSQPRVLSHPSVAAFLTHCGWNSTLESISSGVPMLGWPKFAEQHTNCRYITHVWKIGFDFECHRKDGVVIREEIARKVNAIMRREGEDANMDGVRERVRHLQSAARKAVVKGGHSHECFFKFRTLLQKLLLAAQRA